MKILKKNRQKTDKIYMKKFYPAILTPVVLILTALFASCASWPPASEQVSVFEFPRRPPAAAVSDGAGQHGRPQVPRYIMGRGIISPMDKAAFLLNGNPRANRDFVEALAVFYAEEAAIEGVNHDVAFAQMILETGFLAFGGLVVPEMNNFAGLGSIGPGQHGLWFPDPRTGVRAHIQHLKAYACTKPLNQPLVNPRFRFVTRGSSPDIRGLAGTWAADPLYADKINNILERLYRFAFDF